MKNQIKEIFRYGVVGIITTAVNLFLLKILIELGMYYILANTISYTVGVILSYFLNQQYVFLDSSKNGKKAKEQFFKFFILRIVSLLVDNFLFYFLVTILGFQIYWTRLFLTFAMILGTFIFNKWFVFKQ